MKNCRGSKWQHCISAIVNMRTPFLSDSYWALSVVIRCVLKYNKKLKQREHPWCSFYWRVTRFSFTLTVQSHLHCTQIHETLLTLNWHLWNHFKTFFLRDQFLHLCNWHEIWICKFYVFLSLLLTLVQLQNLHVPRY